MSNNLRQEDGISLTVIILLGVVGCMWMLGTAALIVPTFGKVSIERTNDMMRDGAELALDWAVGELNNSSTRGMIDCSSGQSKTTSVPATIFPAELSNFSGSITVSNTMPPSYSYLYSPGFSGSSVQGVSGFRVVTATVNSPGGNLSKSVRVIMMPSYNVTNTVSTVTTSFTTTQQGNPTPIFNSALASPGAVGGGGNMTTNSYNSATNPNPSSFQNKFGDVTTNTSAGLSGNSSVGGNLTVNSTGSSGKQVASGSGNATVYGNTTANGTVSGINTQGTTTQNANNPPITFPPVPSAPSTATNIGAVSLSGKSSLTLGNGYYILNGTRYSNSGGDYVTSGIQMSGNSSISVDTSNGPVNVYVQGSGSNNGITISGNGISNSGGIPGDFRLWYNGTGPVKFTGNGSMTGVIYSPNAPFQMTGNGTLYGALVGNTIAMSGNGTFHYDQALMNNSSLVWYPPVTVTIQQTNTITIHNDNFTHFQAVSWYEF